MKHARVLIADNDRRLRTQLYTRLLDVDVFSDNVACANDAIEYLRDRRYGVILLDLELAQHESYLVIECVRALPITDRPIILATVVREASPSLDSDLVQIIMRKPLRIADVAEMIRSCVYGGSRRNDVSRATQRPDGPLEALGL